MKPTMKRLQTSVLLPKKPFKGLLGRTFFIYSYTFHHLHPIAASRCPNDIHNTASSTF